MSWQPSASIETLRRRAEMLARLRAFFAGRGVWEVDVPVLGRHGVTDLHIDCLRVESGGQPHYLQSSPEYFMKRLLAVGSGDIYYLGKAFREGEAGPRHNPEFTLLEWYRVGWDEHRLMDEVAELVQGVMAEAGAGDALPVVKLSYGEMFRSVLQLDPHTAPLHTLQQMAAQTAGSGSFYESRATCLDLLFSMRVEPQLPLGIVSIYDYPECQAALACTAADKTGNRIARRFEVFLNRVELANGYFELCDAAEQKARFEKDAVMRREAGKSEMALDDKLLAALAAGVPACAGVAMGVDRLLMGCLGQKALMEVMPFPSERL